MTTEEMLQIKGLMEEVVAPIKTEIADMKTEIADMKTEIADMKTDIAGMKSEIAEIKTDIAGMKSEIVGIKSEMADMKAQIADLDDRVIRIGAYQETIITRSIDALAEGHDIIHEKMRELATQEDLEDIRGDITVLKTVVELHGREIEALKKAQ